MKVKGKLLKVVFFSSVLLLCAFLVADLFTGGPGQGNGDSFMLARPAFAQAAEASFLNQEAGIAAYINVGRSLDLAKARAAFRTIEKETTSYIVGSVALPDYPQSEDAHSYVQRDGWIVVYYSKDEPTSKIVDWKNYSPGKISTKLQLGLAVVGNSLGLAVTDAKYYHFKYPDANRLMIIAGTKFNVKIPGSLVVYERSWTAKWPLFAAGESITAKYTEPLWQYGTFTPAELRSEVSYTVSSRAPDPAFLVLAYRES